MMEPMLRHTDPHSMHSTVGSQNPQPMPSEPPGIYHDRMDFDLPVLAKVSSTSTSSTSHHSVSTASPSPSPERYGAHATRAFHTRRPPRLSVETGGSASRPVHHPQARSAPRTPPPPSSSASPAKSRSRRRKSKVSKRDALIQNVIIATEHQNHAKSPMPSIGHHGLDSSSADNGDMSTLSGSPRFHNQDGSVAPNEPESNAISSDNNILRGAQMLRRQLLGDTDSPSNTKQKRQRQQQPSLDDAAMLDQIMQNNFGSPSEALDAAPHVNDHHGGMVDSFPSQQQMGTEMELITMRRLRSNDSGFVSSITGGTTAFYGSGTGSNTIEHHQQRQARHFFPAADNEQSIQNSIYAKGNTNHHNQFVNGDATMADAEAEIVAAIAAAAAAASPRSALDMQKKREDQQQQFNSLLGNIHIHDETEDSASEDNGYFDRELLAPILEPIQEMQELEDLEDSEENSQFQRQLEIHRVDSLPNSKKADVRVITVSTSSASSSRSPVPSPSSSSPSSSSQPNRHVETKGGGSLQQWRHNRRLQNHQDEDPIEHPEQERDESEQQQQQREQEVKSQDPQLDVDVSYDEVGHSEQPLSISQDTSTTDLTQLVGESVADAMPLGEVEALQASAANQRVLGSLSLSVSVSEDQIHLSHNGHEAAFAPFLAHNGVESPSQAQQVRTDDGNNRSNTPRSQPLPPSPHHSTLSACAPGQQSLNTFGIDRQGCDINRPATYIDKWVLPSAFPSSADICNVKNSTSDQAQMQTLRNTHAQPSQNAHRGEPYHCPFIDDVTSPVGPQYIQMKRNDAGFAHAVKAGDLWQSLCSQHVRFPRTWWNGARHPTLGVPYRHPDLLSGDTFDHSAGGSESFAPIPMTGRVRSGASEALSIYSASTIGGPNSTNTAPWKYFGRSRVGDNPILNEQFVRNRGSAGRVLLHIIVRDVTTLEPVQDIAVGVLHPNARGIRPPNQSFNPKWENCRDVWMALRNRNATPKSTSLLGSTPLWYDEAAAARDHDDIGHLSIVESLMAGQPVQDSPLGARKAVNNTNMRVVFGDQPPFQTLFLLETDLYDVLSEANNDIEDFGSPGIPPALILLETYLRP